MKTHSAKKKLVITGSKGCIGTILKKGLAEIFDLYLIDIKEKKGNQSFKVDISNQYKKLASIFKNKDAVLHLAWNFIEDFPEEDIDYRNKLMAENVYKAAVESGVKRIIMASSVHADNYALAKKEEEFSLKNPWPDSPYGASKVYVEALGRYFAKRHKLEVICVRFGGVNFKDRVIYKEDPNYDKVLLYKKDCIDLTKLCILAKKVPNNFQVFTAVSNNINRVHSVTNFLGWRPKFPKQ